MCEGGGGEVGVPARTEGRGGGGGAGEEEDGSRDVSLHANSDLSIPYRSNYVSLDNWQLPRGYGCSSNALLRQESVAARKLSAS